VSLGLASRYVPPMHRSAVVEVEGLVKRYDGRAVVDGLDLIVREGEIVALLGPNGAGKTTTVEIVEGLRTADGGTVRVFGADPGRDRARIRPRLGVMLQQGELPSQLRVGEAVELFAAFYDHPLDASSLLDRVGLRGLEPRRYRSLSGGERQRLQLALALVGRPRLAILDEPTSSMDAAARGRTWELLQALRGEGGSVLMTTHLVEEAEDLADRVGVIDSGRLVAWGTPGELTRAADGGAHGLREVRLDLEGPLPPAAFERLGRLTGVERLRTERPGSYVLSTRAPDELLVELATWLFAGGILPRSIRLGGSTLEEVVVRLTGESAPDSEQEP
jgi:ABC-2 type transport system ATP-binding protein